MIRSTLLLVTLLATTVSAADGLRDYFVLHALMHLESPVSVEDMYQHVSKGMKIFYSEIEDKPAQEPFLFDGMNEPAYFKTM